MAPGIAHLRDGPTALRVERVVVRHPVGRGSVVHALSDVSFDVAHDETVGLVGESGCGKSTMARAILQLPPPNAGLVRLGDTVLTELRGDALRRQRPRLQIVFQDPTSSLNPRRRITQIVMEPMDIWRVPRDEAVGRAERALRAVGLEPDTVATRRPHELSGGQRQRVSLARALVLEPEFIVLDEPLSALDVSVQAQILELLADVRQRYRLSLLFISHDLAVVKHISDRVAVMYLGKLCEIGPSEAVYARPTHPYTLDLIRAVPRSDPPDEADRGRASPAGGVDIPSPIDPPSGCRFRTRCARARAVCATEEPAVLPVGPSQFVACHFPLTGPAPSA